MQDGRYASPDMNVVCGHYGTLLKALAARTNRVSKEMVVAASKKAIGGPQPKAHVDFGAAVSSALSHCYRSALRATTGEKLPEEVKAIALCFKCPKLDRLREQLTDERLQALHEDTGREFARAEKQPSSCEEQLGSSVGTSSQSGLQKQTSTAEAWSPDPNNEDDIRKMYGMPLRTEEPRTLGRQPSCISVQSVQTVQSSRASGEETEELHQSTCFGILFSNLPRFVFVYLHRWRLIQNIFRTLVSIVGDALLWKKRDNSKTSCLTSGAFTTL